MTDAPSQPRSRPIASLLRGLLLAAALGAPVPSASLSAQQNPLRAVFLLAESDGQPMILRIFPCGPDCVVGRYDAPESAMSMVVRVQGTQGYFVVVDHHGKQIQLVSLQDVAVADLVAGGRRAMAQAEGSAWADLHPTGERRSVSLLDLSDWRGANAEYPAVEVEGIEHAFTFEYEASALPMMEAMSAQGAQGLQNLKWVLEVEGTALLAPDGPAQPELAAFYGMLSKAMLAHAARFSGAGGSGGAFDMTAAMNAALYGLTSTGLPLVSSTTTKLTPKLDQSMPGMDMLLRMMKLPQSKPSRAVLKGFAYARRDDLGAGLPSWASENWLTEGSQVPEGYTMDPESEKARDAIDALVNQGN